MPIESPSHPARTIADGAEIAFHPAADGWPLRSMIWPEPEDDRARGSLLFLGGRGDHFEKYLECFAAWHGRGWQVESFDWRGQGGSGRLAADPHVGHCERYAQWIDDLADYVRQWAMRTPAPHVMVGHSMGGHLLLRALADRRIAPDAVVLVAPMLGFVAPYPDRVGHWIARVMCRIGPPDRAAWKLSEKPGSPVRLRQRLLTHDDGRYEDEMWWRAQNPSLELGPASWRWVEQAYASFRHLATPGLIEGVGVPVLTLVASADMLVSASAARAAAARLPRGTTRVYGAEAAHEILREADAVRDDALAQIDAFFNKEAPRP